MTTKAGNAANAAQWSWFVGHQALHNAQVAMGDAIMSNSRQQQQANDAMMRSWEQRQAIHDSLSQARSDQIVDRRRLVDDAMGKAYEAPSGYRNSWLDQQTGVVTGTDTGDPWPGTQFHAAPATVRSTPQCSVEFPEDADALPKRARRLHEDGLVRLPGRLDQPA